MAKAGKLICDICGKRYDSLGKYESWLICLRCYNNADVMAYREDRWPNETDFAALASAHDSMNDRTDAASVRSQHIRII
jgi:hypothetical protein